MSTYFVPYTEDKPAVIDIKGHRVLILSSSVDDITVDLQRVGGTQIREIQFSEGEPSRLIALAEEVKGGVVLSPPGVRLKSMITSLEAELPWLQ